MCYRKVFCAIVLAALLTVWTGSGSASSELVGSIQQHLYAGKTAEAEAVARGRLTDAPNDDQARFALGAVQFLRAVEHLGQAFHRYGLKSSYSDDTTGLLGLPFLRLPIPENPAPEKVTYEALREVLNALVVDLGTAEQTLGSLKNQTIDLPLNIGLIRLDLDADGAASDEEALWRIFVRVADATWLNEQEAAKLLTDFDGSDVPWLRAYCHLLMAIAEFPLAHDWSDAFEATFHGLFPKLGTPLAALFQKDVEWLAKQAKLGAPLSPKPGEDIQNYYERRRLWIQKLKPEEEQRYRRVQDGAIADLIAFVHLQHWPVIEPQRMRSVLTHFETMVRLSRENWRRILAETDDRNEWIPNPKQTGVLPRMRVTEDRVAGWQRFLDEFEALLQGKKLLPHYRFDKGINLRRVFTEPRTFDIVLMIQGTAAVPYLEDGELTTQETWSQITDVFGGDFFRYFIWFN
jgi:hypothetical protein